MRRPGPQAGPAAPGRHGAGTAPAGSWPLWRMALVMGLMLAPRLFIRAMARLARSRSPSGVSSSQLVRLDHCEQAWPSDPPRPEGGAT